MIRAGLIDVVSEITYERMEGYDEGEVRTAL
jgi:hypothetical protein